MNEVLVDTGPLVAYLDRSDHHHEWAKQELMHLTRPLLSCEAVIAESLFLLRRGGIDPDALLNLIGHEIGHVLVGYGHPDKDTGGPAPLVGTDWTARLMCSHPNRSQKNGRLLVKCEWEAAEIWLDREVDNEVP